MMGLLTKIVACNPWLQKFCLIDFQQDPNYLCGITDNSKYVKIWKVWINAIYCLYYVIVEYFSSLVSFFRYI